MANLDSKGGLHVLGVRWGPLNQESNKDHILHRILHPRQLKHATQFCVFIRIIVELMSTGTTQLCCFQLSAL